MRLALPVAAAALPLCLLATAAGAAPRRHARTAQATPRTKSPAAIVSDIEGAPDAQAREERCREQTGYRGEAFEACSAELIAHGSVALVRIVTSCGPDGCETAGWLASHSGGMARMPGDAEGVVEALPGLDVVVKDRVQRDAHGEWSVSLVRIDLRAGRATPFAPCMSPVLSPGARWFVCRDAKGGVLRVPVRGGHSDSVATAEPRDYVDFAPAARVYPDPVAFSGERALTYERKTSRDAAPETVTVSWRE
jgi:hypothetical protein